MKQDAYEKISYYNINKHIYVQATTENQIINKNFNQRII